MPEIIYTLGYQQRTIDEFVAIVRGSGVEVLVDVRETAWSHKPGFSKAAFARALSEAGIDYVHAAFAGNPKWLRENAGSHHECLSWYDWYLTEFEEVVEAFEQLVAEIAQQGRRAALTCYERHAADCHRSILAERWVRRAPSRRVEHLAVEGCLRLAGP
jgi:uncharacterized protein (DUF488 family)